MVWRPLFSIPEFAQVPLRNSRDELVGEIRCEIPG